VISFSPFFSFSRLFIQPLMTLIFGDLIQAFVNFGVALNNAKNGVPGAAEQVPAAAAFIRHAATVNAVYYVYIGKPPVDTGAFVWFLLGIGMFVCTYVYMWIWAYTGEVNAKRIREKYLKAILRQEIAYFDKVGAGEVATRIQTDTRT
jgi:ATP-binding cassette, subfamily B (MDR/TAP), member 1